MQCKCSHLKYGDKVTIEFTGNANCVNCGNDMTALGSVNATYAGHSGDFDLFYLEKIEYCPACKEAITGYSERCGEFGGLQIEVVEQENQCRK